MVPRNSRHFSFANYFEFRLDRGSSIRAYCLTYVEVFYKTVEVVLNCVIGGIRDPKFRSKAIQWVDQTNGRSINTFKSGRTIKSGVSYFI